MTRRRPVHRLTSALIGAIVTACGALTIALLSGYDLDTELIAIIALATVGGWLLLTALLAGRTPRSQRHAAMVAPVIEEPYTPTARDTFSTPDEPTPPAAVTEAAEATHAAPDEADAPPLTAAARRAAERARAKAAAKGDA